MTATSAIRGRKDGAYRSRDWANAIEGVGNSIFGGETQFGINGTPPAAQPSSSTQAANLMEPGTRRRLLEDEITKLTGIDASGTVVGRSYTRLSRDRLQEIWINAAGESALFPNYGALNPVVHGIDRFSEASGNAVTYGENDVLFPSSGAELDFTTGDFAWLVHEVMHIWQYSQYGVPGVWGGATSRDYNYTIRTDAGHIIDDYGIEEQAAMMGDLYRRENGMNALNAYTATGARDRQINPATLRAELFQPQAQIEAVRIQRVLQQYNEGIARGRTPPSDYD